MSSEHGKFVLRLAGPTVLWATCAGSWNEETAKRYVKETKLIIQQMPELTARVVDLLDWEFCTPEARKELNGFYDWLSTIGTITQIEITDKKLIDTIHMNRIRDLNEWGSAKADSIESAVEILKAKEETLFEDFMRR